MNYSQAGIDLTKDFEGCRLKAYQDQKKVWTIGYGHTKGVKQGMTCTQEQAEEWLREDVGEAEATVARLVKVPITQNQYDALVDFCFNLGTKNFYISTLRKLLNKSDYQGCANEFEKWNLVDGLVNAGIIRRRKAEKALFLKGMI